MEKRIKRPAGLTALFWRYLITTSAVILLLAILWWMGLTILMQMKVVYPASTAADGVDNLISSLTAGTLTPEEIPYYYRWAVFDGGYQLIDAGNMNERRLAYAKSALAGDSAGQGIFYTQYHRIAKLSENRFCVVQYDYSMPYGMKTLQERLPEFQTCALLVLLVCCLGAGTLLTRHFAGLLRRDADLLTSAAQTIARQRLDEPLNGQARVREFGDTLAAMDKLRASLAQSLKDQWAMEQQRRLELAALTHDLKTPLTVISGNAELLEEDALNPTQKEMVETILRSAVRVQEYLVQLRAMTSPEGMVEQQKEQVSLEHLAEGWKRTGQSLCGAKQVEFICSSVPSVSLWVYPAALDRAVMNLLDNAVRYAPAGGKVVLNILLEAKKVKLSVEDTGPGFSAAALAKGGQPFFTSDASRSQEGHLGMGLFYAAQTAKQHGGSLHLSNTSQGAKVELDLPVTHMRE
ncbi:sensor histidine kinase [Fournierella massiliensis]|uniref:sensor histidine kinase n=1 Tax=Allofournierella massiliensis TaxID=1650663 RepID=UPI0035211BE1